jgi:hypothetical protein
MRQVGTEELLAFHNIRKTLNGLGVPRCLDISQGLSCLQHIFGPIVTDLCYEYSGDKKRVYAS